MNFVDAFSTEKSAYHSLELHLNVNPQLNVLKIPKVNECCEISVRASSIHVKPCYQLNKWRH